MRPVPPVRFVMLSLPRPSLRLTAPQVYEEIGFDISPFLVEADYVETVQHQQSTKLFIVSGISEQARACAHPPVPARSADCPSAPDGLRAANTQGN